MPPIPTCGSSSIVLLACTVILLRTRAGLPSTVGRTHCLVQSSEIENQGIVSLIGLEGCPKNEATTRYPEIKGTLPISGWEQYVAIRIEYIPRSLRSLLMKQPASHRHKTYIQDDPALWETRLSSSSRFQHQRQFFGGRPGCRHRSRGFTHRTRVSAIPIGRGANRWVTTSFEKLDRLLHLFPRLMASRKGCEESDRFQYVYCCLHKVLPSLLKCATGILSVRTPLALRRRDGE